MSSTYKGQPANILGNMPAPTGIGGVTVANPATIVTSPAHGLQTGDYVHVYGHTTTTTINGIWPVTVVDPTHFSIAINAGGTDSSATGAVQALTIGTYPIPSDGDDVDAAAVNPAEEEMGDRTTYLSVSTGAYKLAGMQNWTGSDSPGTPWFTVTGLSATTWTPSGESWALGIPVVAGDIVEVELTSTLDSAGSTAYAAASLWSSNVADGVSVSYTQMAGSDQTVPLAAVAAPCALRGQRTIATSGVFSAAVYVFADTNGNGVEMTGAFRMSMKIWRPTGMVQ